ncbi:tetratricopeptide repeat protein [Wolbachia endosymbiont of Atemnus politus]|nr:tetratricopeptide repeat protein [Wolbachia endosymbiont of Atemnus politus]
MLGLNDKDTLSTRSIIASVLHRLGKDEEAFNIYQTVYQKQKEILGTNHSDTLDTQLDMALVLDRQGKYEEALNINRAVFEKIKEMSGANDPSAVRAQNNIAMVLANQGKYEEALKIYKEVFKKKKVILGINHADTLRTLHNIAGILHNQKKYHEALKAHQELLNIQKNVLGSNHPDTLNTQYNLADVLFAQGKNISAFKAYRECLDQMKAVFGPSHPSVLDILKKIEIINFVFKQEGSKESEILQYLTKNINIAASNGDIQTVQRLLKDGADVNDKDIEGIVKSLLTHGAIYDIKNNEGKTPLDLSKDQKVINLLKLVEELFGDARNGNLRVINKLKSIKPDEFIVVTSARSNQGNTLLQVAIVNKHKNITSELLEMLKEARSSSITA